MNADFLSSDELFGLGLRTFGTGVLIHKTCVLVGRENISIGNNVRIDPYTLISAKAHVDIGSYSHIAAHGSLMGSFGITIGDFCGVSHGCRLLSASDDFKAGALIGPQVPDEYRAVRSGRVVLEEYSCLGANSVVLPGAVVGRGATIGALSLVADDVEPWCVSAGVPAKVIGTRDQIGVLEAARRFREFLASNPHTEDAQHTDS